MKKFKFALEGYLKVKKAHEQQKLGELAQVMRRVNAYREIEQAFELQYNSMLQTEKEKFRQVQVPISRLKDMYDYLGALKIRRDSATRHLAEMENEVSAKRNAYNQARKERRVIEILREKKLAAYKLDVEKEEQKNLDEVNDKVGAWQ
ncbi:MAG TPA: flagellar export protein FliJ [Turneriella sp.]|nr:flagellar export protein FliJ [Turneriella sp.]